MNGHYDLVTLSVVVAAIATRLVDPGTTSAADVRDWLWTIECRPANAKDGRSSTSTTTLDCKKDRYGD
jgi:hypothetical protein